MESRIAIIGIIVEDIDASSKVNDILHDYGMYILGRMGIPFTTRRCIYVFYDNSYDRYSTFHLYSPYYLLISEMYPARNSILISLSSFFPSI